MVRVSFACSRDSHKSVEALQRILGVTPAFMRPRMSFLSSIGWLTMSYSVWQLQQSCPSSRALSRTRGRHMGFRVCFVVLSSIHFLTVT